MTRKRNFNAVRWMFLSVVIMAVILIPFFAFGLSFEESVRAFLESAARHSFLTGVLLVLLLASDIALPVPSSLVSTSAGFLLGFPGGLLASWAGMSLGCVIGYELGVVAGHRISLLLPGDRELARLETLNRRFGHWLIVLTRPVPVLAEASVLFAGSGRMPRLRFLGLSALSNAGISAVYAATGAFSASRHTFLLAFAASLILPLIGMLLHRTAENAARRRGCVV